MSQQRIQILPPHLVNRIAAGEVVERPASVVKELVENALDAAATRIDIFIGAGGRNIRIADNGSGMSPEDARLAFYNHATSKLGDEETLFRIETLGFRGEALASIAAISRVTCLTRPESLPSGTRVLLEGAGQGAEPVLSEAGCAPGTIMEVTDLFYNTPARLKFLKRPQTETAHIEEVVQSLALSHPHVRFQLTINGKNMLITHGTGDLLTTLQDVFHLDSREADKLIPVHYADTEAGLQLSGHISLPDIQKTQKRWTVTMVNRRHIRCAIFSKAIETAYKSLLPEGRYPVAVLSLEIDPQDIDVNVHPAKREIRYARSSEIFGFIRTALLRTLEENGCQLYRENPNEGPHEAESGIRQNETPQGNPRENQETPPPSRETIPTGSPFRGNYNQKALALYQPLDYTVLKEAAPALSNPTSRDPELMSPDAVSPDDSAIPVEAPFSADSMRVIGQFLNTYILLETRQGLMIVDQHIASERTFFEALSRLMETPEASQNLLLDVPLPITPIQRDLLEENRQSFHRLGFQYDFPSGDSAYQVLLTSIPMVYQDRTHPPTLFQTLLRDLEETGGMRLDLDRLIATLACHSAVRAGDLLGPQEMNLIIERWLDCRLPWTCPHGRPIAHTIPAGEINTFFDRQSLPVGCGLS